MGDRRAKSFRWRVLLSSLVAASMLLVTNLEFGAAPPADSRIISVVIRYSGIEPAELERIVTEPLESKLSAVSGLKSLRSSTEVGRVRVRAAVRNDTALDDAYGGISDRVDALYEMLPEAVQRPQIIRGDTESVPIMVIALVGEELSSRDVRRLADDELSAQVERVAGIAEARVSGGAVEEIHIDVNSAVLASARIDWHEVTRTLRDRHTMRSAGSLRAGTRTRPVVLDARLDAPEYLESLLVPVAATPIALDRFAAINRQAREPESISRVDGERTVLMHITAAAEANLLAVSRAVETTARGWSGTHPVRISIVYNAGDDAVVALRRTGAALGAALVAVLLVVGVAAHSAARAMETALVLPLGMLFTAAIVSAIGRPLDPQLLAGFAVSCGLVVDAAIILSGRHAKASITAVVTSTLTTVAALLPFLIFPDLLPGAESIALAAALLVALSTPAALLVRKCELFADRSRVSHAIASLPGRLVALSTRHVAPVLTATAATVAVVALLAVRAGSDSRLSAEVETIRIHAEFERGASVRSVDRRTNAIAAELESLSAVDRIDYTARRDNASISVYLNHGAAPAEVIPEIEAIDAALAHVQLQLADGGESHGSTTAIEIAVTGPDRDMTRSLASSLAAALLDRSGDGADSRGRPAGRQTEPATGVVLHYKDDPPALIFRLDRHRLAATGLSPREVGQTLRWALHGPVVLKWQEHGGETDVRLRSVRDDVRNPEHLLSLPLLHSGGDPVPIGAVGEMRRANRPARIDRYNRRRASFLTVSYPTRSLERALGYLRGHLDAEPLPAGYAVQIDHRYRRRIRRYARLWATLAGTALAVALLTAAATESMRIAGLSLLAIPPTVALTLVPFLIDGSPLSGGVLVGAVMLAGIAVNNAILIGSVARSEPVEQAIAARTADLLLAGVTTAVASIPLLILSGGSGQSATGEAVAGVLLAGTLANTAVTYLVLPAIWNALTRRKNAGAKSAETASPPRAPTPYSPSGAMKSCIDGTSSSELQS